jgi:hypothetical protein
MKVSPEDSTIIKRAGIEVNDFAQKSWQFISQNPLRILFIVCMSAALLGGCSSDESKAKSLQEKAREAMSEQRLDDAYTHYKEVVDRYPNSSVVDDARERITFIQGLSTAVDKFSSRTARDLVIKTARAIQNYRRRQGSYPKSLDALMPKLLSEPSIDPWGRPLLYERRGRGYRLSCLGADGRQGGSDEATDFVVVNGNFVSNPSGE